MNSLDKWYEMQEDLEQVRNTTKKKIEMSKFARIIELENGEQVLLTVNYNNEDDNYELEIRTDLENGTPTIKLGFKTQERAQEALGKYTHSDAVKFRTNMVKMFT